MQLELKHKEYFLHAAQDWGRFHVELYKVAPDQRSGDTRILLLSFETLPSLARRLLLSVVPTFMLARLGPLHTTISACNSAEDWVEEHRGKMGSLG